MQGIDYGRVGVLTSALQRRDQAPLRGLPQARHTLTLWDASQPLIRAASSTLTVIHPMFADFESQG